MTVWLTIVSSLVRWCHVEMKLNSFKIEVSPPTQHDPPRKGGYTIQKLQTINTHACSVQSILYRIGASRFLLHSSRLAAGCVWGLLKKTCPVRVQRQAAARGLRSQPHKVRQAESRLAVNGRRKTEKRGGDRATKPWNRTCSGRAKPSPYPEFKKIKCLIIHVLRKKWLICKDYSTTIAGFKHISLCWIWRIPSYIPPLRHGWREDLHETPYNWLLKTKVSLQIFSSTNPVMPSSKQLRGFKRQPR